MPIAPPAARRRAAGGRASRLLAPALVGAFVLTGCTTIVDGSAEYAPAGAEGRVVREPCPRSEFECVTLGVPADHFTEGSPTWDVTFAVHRAPVVTQRVFVVATGGPGSSGIAEADARLATLPPEITETSDVVFFDQRGVGRSEPFRCDRALSSGGEEVVDSTSTPAERDAYAADAEEFGASCFAEAGVDPADAGRYATRQAVEDLESFRDWLDADQLVLYGESYGTQFQQAYAAAHPDRVAALVLDGVVDLSTDDLSFGIEAAQAYSDVLTGTLTACDASRACAADAPGSTLAGYDRLAAELADGPRTVDFPLPDGTTEERELTLEALRTAASWSMSDPWSRQQFQQVLNAEANGNPVPLIRLASASAGLDPETGVPVDDPSFSTALFFAVQCADYDVVPEGSTGREQLDVWLEAGRTAGVDQLRLGDVFYSDLPCLFWPETGAVPAPPATVTDPPYPVLLLTADTDPNTPTVQAERLLQRTAGDVALVVEQGGPHVVYGRGNRCVDDAVQTLVDTGALAATGRTVCPGTIAGDYLPIAPATAVGYTDPDATVDVLLRSVLENPDQLAWDGYGELEIGCDAGGSATYELEIDGDLHVDLDGCAWTADVPVDGEVTVTEQGAGEASASLELPFAELELETSGALSGTFRGDDVD